MATLLFGMNVSLDGFVDHDKFAPCPDLFRHFVQQAQDLTGSIYGRRLYEIMRYWDQDDPDWGPDHRAFAEAWRMQRKWVVSRTLTEVGPNADLLTGDLETAVRAVKAGMAGEIEVGGPVLAQALGDMGLIDTYEMYIHPVVLGAGNRYFQGARSRLRLMAHDRIGKDAIRLTYVPA